MLLALLQTLRPRQWIKNLFVAVPLVFSHQLTNPASALVAFAAVGLFCLISGNVYIINDLLDLDKDRNHPKKRLRPLASGRLSPTVARNFGFISVPLALLLGALLEPWYAVWLASYFVLNLAYSLYLKRIAYVDVLSITLGFILRVLAGAAAVRAPASIWLILCTALLAMFLGFGKRTHELQLGKEQAEKQRSALSGYHLTTLRWILYILAVATVTIYALYTQSSHVRELFATDKLVYTSIFPCLGVIRFIQLIITRRDAESPTEEMLKDPLFMSNFIVWLVLTISILYHWI